MKALALAALSAAAMLAAMGDALAAVRVCQPPVTGDSGPSPSEMEGKRMALSRWAEAAAAHGSAYASWRIADNKSLRCQAGGDGHTHCRATANPCIIRQVAPPDAVPLTPPAPKAPAPAKPGGPGIDT